MQLTEEQTKQIEALCRAMPISRMVDYGMRPEAAAAAHAAVRQGHPWDLVLEELGAEQAANAQAENDPACACDLWHTAAASLTFAQMAFNADCERKRRLYRQMNACFARFAALSEFRVARIEAPYRNGALFGWRFCTNGSAARGSVIVFGGMSGWSTAYRSLAEALCRRGLDCLLVDGPGQGDSRLEGGIFVDQDVTAGFSRFVDWIREQSPDRPIGLWGNSFGGLLAALTASQDTRVAACCINGGLSMTEVPPFRTAQEQLAAMFGVDDSAALSGLLPSLTFDGARRPLTCATLVLEGGADPLVKLGSQHRFLDGNSHELSRVETWPDGEHCIYNHAAERNALVADWFAEALAPRAGAPRSGSDRSGPHSASILSRTESELR